MTMMMTSVMVTAMTNDIGDRQYDDDIVMMRPFHIADIWCFWNDTTRYGDSATMIKSMILMMMTMPSAREPKSTERERGGKNLLLGHHNVFQI